MTNVKKKILVVEDEPDLVLMLEARLTSEGYEVHSAFDGLEGIKKAKKVKPDIILVDIMMPKLDGYSMSKRLKEDDITTGIPIVVISGKDTMRSLFKALGVNHYFTKPIKMDELLTAIANILADSA
ncbi:MAG: response regulator [Candidatus Omnitrophica bacterium]|nr:response regulator [Candidatus Omnitrophota bacterium]